MEKVTIHTPRGNIIKIAYWAIKRELKMRKQRNFVYCPRCNFEMSSMNNAIEEKDGLVFHVCKNCGVGSKWDYDMPAPVNVT